MAAAVPLHALLTFPVDGSGAASGSRSANGSPAQSAVSAVATPAARTALAPPDSHLVVTTSYPAPAAFAPLYHARQALSAGHAVVWIACSGCGEEHVRRALRSSCSAAGGAAAAAADSGGSGRAAAQRKRNQLVYLDALDDLVGGSLMQSVLEDARPALLRLKHRLEQVLRHLTRHEGVRRSRSGGSNDSSSSSETEVRSDSEEESERRGWMSSDNEGSHRSPVTVIIDDAAVLAWTIMSLSESAHEAENKETARHPPGGGSSREEDPRVRLLRDKRRQGAEAIHRDDIGTRLGACIEELRQECCRPFGAVLVTHLTADNTSVTPPAPRTAATRGGSYGVGTGFDADDAGEENEEEELYEDIEEDGIRGDGDDEDVDQDTSTKYTTEERAATTTPGQAGLTSSARAAGFKLGHASTRATGVAAASIDWRVDSLLRRLLPDADIWVEIRGLRSGRARDCHGELCMYGLARPCLARAMPLPHLPMPADPLAALRTRDRSARPLKHLSRLSLRPGPTTGRSEDDVGAAKSASGRATPLRRWALTSWCEGRDTAMLFRIEPSGDAVAWSRGAQTGASTAAAAAAAAAA